MSRIQDCFELAAARFPGRPCLSVAGRVWQYDELQAAQRRIADTLTGVGLAGVPIGLLGEKSFAMFAAMLGVLSSGNAYVPLGLREPPKRLGAQVRQATLAAVLCAPELRGRLRAALDLDDAARPQVSVEGEALDLVDLRPATTASAAASGLAYLILTSGSTGIPKAVPISHHHAVSFVNALSAVLPVEPSDRVLQAADLSFDLSVGEIFPTWHGGGCVAVPSAEEKLALPPYCEQEKITIWSSVPTLAAAMVSMRAVRTGMLRHLRRSLFCGEALPVSLADAWRCFAPGAELVNLYGPTEATVCVTWFRYTGGLPEDLRIVPIGAPLPGVGVRIDPLEGHPDGRGELLLSGDQVAGRYWGDPVATAAAFDDTSAGVWYRTGDVVRLSPDHGLLFVGRRDQQIKMSGFRIDLLEVESHLRALTRAHVAVVPVAQADGRVSGIVAFVEGACSASDLTRMCGEELPPHMVPRRFVPLGELPRTSSGKVDRVRLAKMLQADGSMSERYGD
ncbi:AMP-binding protein [Sorangium sp. So ce367]|uniref:AMP-binding protein n=1 Tax=Sorangium sp. So ce367 TaxID=3133305 RepID=UPI003F61CD95